MAERTKEDTEEHEYPENFKAELDTSTFYRVRERKIWDLSLLFLEGRQWVGWDAQAGGYTGTVSTARNTNNYKITVNLLLNIYRNLLSKLATTYPSIVVTPASPSTEDILKAQASEILLKYYWNQDDVKNVLMDAFGWMLSCGTVGLHSYYNAEESRVTTEVISPFDLIFEPYVLSPEDSNYIAIRRHTTRAELESAYPDRKELIKDAVDALEQIDRPGAASYGEVPKGRLETFEVYWRDGKHAIILNENYLYKGVNPISTIPIEVIRYSDIPGKLWGIGMVSPLIDMQWLYNKSRSQVLQNIELMANPKWLIPKSCGVNPQAITNRAGEKVFYNAAGGAPTQIAAAPLPSHVFDNITRLQSEMMDVSGIHSTSLGKRAVGVTSGKAMQTLQEMDMSQLQQTQLRIEDHVKNMAESVLELMKAFYTEDKMIRSFDGSGKIVFQQLSNANLVDHPEIFIESNSLFRAEQQDKDRKIFDMLEMGLIDQGTAIKEVSFKTGNKYVVEKMQTMAHAQELLTAATQGFDIEIFKTDDLDSFREVFGSFIRGTEYYSLPLDRQDYIRDIYIAIEQGGASIEDVAKANVLEKVFPRQPEPTATIEQHALNIAGQSSGAAKDQALSESISVGETATGFEETERVLARRGEALMSPRPTGGVG
jgi:hypothetical protein